MSVLEELHPQKNWKVKVYLLNSEGNWNDYGAGQLSLSKEMDEITEIELEYFKVMQNTTDSTEQQQVLDPEKIKKLTKKYKTHQSHSPNSPSYFQNPPNQVCLLYLKVNKENEYDKQGDSIITWVDRDIDEEVALSFLDCTAATETWRHICQSIGKNPDETTVNEDELNKLPLPEQGNLIQILENIEVHSSKMIQLLGRKQEFMDKLCLIFDTSEDLEQDDQLKLIYQIFKSLVFLNDVSVLSILISDKYYKTCFGAFEYKPENQGEAKNNYRDFLENHLQFKQVVEIKDQSIQQKIHQNYRLQYLKDSIIASYIEDTTASQINYITFQNNTEICSYFLQSGSSQELLSQFFEQFLSNVEDSIGFLIEFQQIIKIAGQGNIYQNEKNQIFLEKVTKFQIFETFTASIIILQNKRKQIDQNREPQQYQKVNQTLIQLLECLVFIITISPPKFISFLLSKDTVKSLPIKKSESIPTPQENGDLEEQPTEEKEDKIEREDDNNNNDNNNENNDKIEIEDNNQIACTPQVLLQKLAELFAREDIAIKVLIGQEIMRLLFEANQENKIDIFDIVFKFFITPTIIELKNHTNNPTYTSFVIQLLEILTIVYKSGQNFKIHQFFSKEKFFNIMGEKLQKNNKSINLAIIKFYRTIFQAPFQQSSSYLNASSVDQNIKLIVKNNHLDPLMTLFIKNGNRTNLINSSLLELFETISKNNIKIAIKYIIKNWIEKIKEKNLEKLLNKVVIQHEKNEEKEERGESLFNLGQNPVISEEQQKNIQMLEEERYYDDDDEGEEEKFGGQIEQQSEDLKQQTEEKNKEKLNNLLNKMKKKKAEEEEEDDVFNQSQSNDSQQDDIQQEQLQQPQEQEQLKEQSQVQVEVQENDNDNDNDEIEYENSEENKIQKLENLQEEDEEQQQQQEQKIAIMLDMPNKKRKKSELDEDEEEEALDEMLLQSKKKQLKQDEEQQINIAGKENIMDIELNNISYNNNSNSNCSSSNKQENGQEDIEHQQNQQIQQQQQQQLETVDLSKSKLVDNSITIQQNENDKNEVQTEQQEQQQQIENV